MYAPRLVHTCTFLDVNADVDLGSAVFSHPDSCYRQRYPTLRKNRFIIVLIQKSLYLRSTKRKRGGKYVYIRTKHP